MKKNLSILDFEDKKTIAGARYTRFKTEDGWLSCFDTKTCDMLKNLESASVEIKESGDFKNIAKCYGSADGEVEAPIKTERPGEPVKSKNNFSTMYVSYVKDLVVAGKSVEEAIKVIKQAQEAFS